MLEVYIFNNSNLLYLNYKMDEINLLFYQLSE